eukprot:Mycagemm_TRINITY_DN8207_c0_g2::TRINITY_DN8207_c0_g2_i1::g.1968::m.1968 type:complete len:155 gc:universal TRINITY_DN8207_c0_g2_i1:470-6(-)
MTSRRYTQAITCSTIAHRHCLVHAHPLTVLPLYWPPYLLTIVTLITCLSMLVPWLSQKIKVAYTWRIAKVGAPSLVTSTLYWLQLHKNLVSSKCKVVIQTVLQSLLHSQLEVALCWCLITRASQQHALRSTLLWLTKTQMPLKQSGALCLGSGN